MGLRLCIPAVIGLLAVWRHNAGNKMDFTKGKFEPKSASSILQALSCRFVGCNCVIHVNSWSPKVKPPPQESIDPTLLYILVLETCSKFVWKNKMLVLGDCFPQIYSLSFEL